jgi:hypothetical protein
MKQRLLYISLLLLALAVAACAPIEDDLFTTARITVAATDGTSITGVQAQVKLTNVNTRQVTTVADFNGTSVTVELLRGAYQVSIEGVLSYTDTTGNKRIRSFRAVSDYVELATTGTSKATINIIYLD